jgi:dienelactone hydrolase
MMRTARLALALSFAVLASCAADVPQDAGSPAGADGATGGQSGRGAGAGEAGNAGSAAGSGGPSSGGTGAPDGGGATGDDASTDAPDGGASSRDASADASVQTVPAEPAQPCGEALDAQRGIIALDLGSFEQGAPRQLDGDPANDGPYDVIEVSATIPNPDAAREALPATFYLPAPSDATERAPLVLVMHGFGLTHPSYAHFSRHFASHGLIALGISLPPSLTAAHDKNAAEAIAAIDFALGADAPAEVLGRVDPDRIAASGHSLGGKIAFYAAAIDPRIDIVIGWDPSNAGGPPCFIDPAACNGFPVAPNCLGMASGLVHMIRAESLVFRAAADGANPEPAHNAIHFYRGAPAPATLLDFEQNVLHGDFADASSAVIAHTRRVQLALVLDRFFGTSGLAAYLPGGAEIASDPLLARVLSR